MAGDGETRGDTAADMAALRAAYVARLPDELAALHVLAERADKDDTDRSARESLQRQLHKLAGSGGSYGLTSLSLQARRLEEQLTRWLDGTNDRHPTRIPHRHQHSQHRVRKGEPRACGCSRTTSNSLHSLPSSSRPLATVSSDLATPATCSPPPSPSPRTC